MNHAITVGGLLLSIGIVASTLAAAYGAFDAYGNMMADAAGDNGKQGCTIFIVGIVGLVGCIAGLFL
jgi:hypothetical protein